MDRPPRRRARIDLRGRFAVGLRHRPQPFDQIRRRRDPLPAAAPDRAAGPDGGLEVVTDPVLMRTGNFMRPVTETKSRRAVLLERARSPGPASGTTRRGRCSTCIGVRAAGRSKRSRSTTAGTFQPCRRRMARSSGSICRPRGRSAWRSTRTREDADRRRRERAARCGGGRLSPARPPASSSPAPGHGRRRDRGRGRRGATAPRVSAGAPGHK